MPALLDCPTLARLHQELWRCYRDRGDFALFCLLDKLDLNHVQELVVRAGPLGWTEVDPRLLLLPGAEDTRCELLWWGCRPVATWTRRLVRAGRLPTVMQRLSRTDWRVFMDYLRGPEGLRAWREVKRELDRQRRAQRPCRGGFSAPAGSRCRSRSGP